ncbi:MAG: ABC transporter substrate-binding protein [Hydrogenoanaerobacterium sp.]
MKTRKILAALLAFILIFAVSACAKKNEQSSSDKPTEDSPESISEEDTGYPVSIGDVKITMPPEKIVSLSPAITELLCDLGYREKIIGISDFCSYEAEDISSLPRLGTVGSTQTEDILSLNPQLVLSVSPISATAQEALKKADITVLVLPRANSLDELCELYKNISKIFDGEKSGGEKGQAFFDKQNAVLTAISEKVMALEKQPEAAYLRVMPLTLATGDSFEGRLLEKCGFKNSAASYTGWVYPKEAAAGLMPDIIFYDKTIGLDALKATQIYSTTPAYANEKCFETDMEVFERQGKRMFTMLEEMTKKACPKAFENS